MNGWLGQSLVCYATPLEAARSSCAGMAGCQGVTGEGAVGPGDSLLMPVMTITGASTVAIQPCARLDGQFFSSLLSVAIPAVIAILCARAIWAQFKTHA